MASEPHKRKVVVIGAGFSGLTVSYYFLKNGFDVEIFESSDRVGGLINTISTQFGLIETAANGLLNCKELEELCSDIGVELVSTLKEARRRFIFRKGKAKRWPLNFNETIRLIRFIVKFVRNKTSVSPQENETVQQWGERMLGTSASQYSIETAVQGIYGTEASNLTAKLVLARLFSSSSKSNGNLKFGKGTVAPANGMGELLSKLASFLEQKGVRIHFGKEIKNRNDVPEHNFLVVATSVKKAAELLESLNDSRASQLRKVKMLPLTTTTVFAKNLKSNRPKGFGVLFPPNDSHSTLGVLFNNCIFPNRTINCESDTWMTKGVSLSDETLMSTISQARKTLLGEDSKVLSFHITRWAKALPSYDFELSTVLSKIKTVENGIALIGNYLGEIGLRNILLRAQRVANEVAEQIR